MSTTTTCLELSLPAVPSSVRAARNAVSGVVRELASNERLADDVRLCVSEAVTNVVRHAYGPRRGSVELVVDHVDGELSVRVRDTGHGFVRASRTIGSGGFGLKILAKLAARHFVRARPDGGTEVTMFFLLHPDADVRPRR